MATLTHEARYARLAETDWLGVDGLAKIQRSSIAIVGVGNIGGQLAQHFVMMGSGLILVDRDIVSIENFGTQGFSSEEDVGRPKVDARARSLLTLNSSSRVEPLASDISVLGMGALRHADLIFGCLDNRRGRVVINEIATRLGIPWIDTGIDGTGKTMIGRVAAYDTLSESSACYLCPHDGESLREIAEEGTPPGCPQLDGSVEIVTPPTLAVSALGGAVAAGAAITGLSMLLGKSSGVISHEAYLDLDRMVLETHALKRNPNCPSDHRALSLVTLDGVRTVGEGFAIATEKLGGEPVLKLVRRTLVRRMHCPDCRREKKLDRILETMPARERGCECGGLMNALGGYVTDRIDFEDVRRFGRRSWKRLGLPANDIVIASRGSAEIALLLP